MVDKFIHDLIVTSSASFHPAEGRRGPVGVVVLPRPSNEEGKAAMPVPSNLPSAVSIQKAAMAGGAM